MIPAAEPAGGDGARPGYLALFRAPGVPFLTVSMVVARMPTGITTLLTILFVGTSYGASAAGLAAGTRMAVSALFSPWFGRLVDRGMGRRILLILAGAHVVAMSLLIVLVTIDAPQPLVLVAAGLCGLATPPVAGITRSLWPTLVEKRLLPVAYGLEVLIIDILFVTGPLLASVCVFLFDPATGLAVSSVGLVVGSFMLANSSAVIHQARTRVAAERIRSAVPLLRSPRIVALLVVAVFTGAFSGWVEVLVPVYATSRGSASGGGILIAIWSIGSIIGVLAFVRWQPQRMPHGKQLVIFTSIFLASSAGLWFAGPLASLAVFLFIIGLCVSPGTNLQYQLAGDLADHSRHAEMFTWMNLSSGLGLSAGAALGGLAFDNLGESTTLVLPSVLLLIAVVAAVVIARRERGVTHGVEVAGP